MEGYTKIGRIRPVFQGLWNSAKNYTVLDMVRSADGAAAYIALQDVPAGTQLTNAAYWGVAADVSAARDSANAAAAAAKNMPYIGANGNWYIYDTDKNVYIDSGNPSRGEGGSGSGSDTPDLVIKLTAPRESNLTEVVVSNFSVESGDVSAVIAKVRNFENPTIILKTDYYYGDLRYVGIATASSVLYLEAGVDNYGDGLRINFDLPIVGHPETQTLMGIVVNASGSVTNYVYKVIP